MAEVRVAGLTNLNHPGVVGLCEAVIAEDLLRLLAHGSVLRGAAAAPGAISFRGRGVAYGLSAPASGLRIFVRRSRHGGVLAPLTGQIFLAPGRALREIQTAKELAARGVATPKVLGCVIYPVGAAAAAPLIARGVRLPARIDMVLQLIEGCTDLAQLLAREERADYRIGALRGVAALLRNLAAARVHHPDLNLRNILVSRAEPERCWLIDVDRVVLDSFTPDGAHEANVHRLIRSLEKLRGAGEIRVSDDERRILTDDAQVTER